MVPGCVPGFMIRSDFPPYRGGNLNGTARPVRVQALDVGEHDELGGAERHGQRGGDGVRVDVVDLAAGAPGNARHHGHPPVGEQHPHGAGVNGIDLTDQPDVHRRAVHHRVPPARGEQIRVLPRHAHRERAVPVDQAHHIPVHLAGEHHANHVHGLRRGDPQPRGKRALQPEPRQVGGNLRPAAVNHDRAQPRVAQEHHILGEAVAQRLVGHRVAAVLDDHRLAVEPVQPGQGLDQRRGLGLCYCASPGGHSAIRGTPPDPRWPWNPPGRTTPGSGAGRRHLCRGHVEYAEFSCT